jgi:hypothetical protein
MAFSRGFGGGILSATITKTHVYDLAFIFLLNKMADSLLSRPNHSVSDNRTVTVQEVLGLFQSPCGTNRQHKLNIKRD